jgi:hypothetical protein
MQASEKPAHKRNFNQCRKADILAKAAMLAFGGLLHCFWFDWGESLVLRTDDGLFLESVSARRSQRRFRV